MAAVLAGAMTFSYDVEGDILYLESTAPYAEQRSADLGDGVIARLNPSNRIIEGLEILGFSRRFAALDDTLTLPVGIEMHEIHG